MQRHSTTSPLLSLPGAVAAEGRDEGVAAHYGDLFREQRALADGRGFVDLSHRGVGGRARARPRGGGDPRRTPPKKAQGPRPAPQARV
ncbi:hypothetical protein AB0B81_05390, partial [Streptomyces sp. NPDC039028]